MTRTAGGAPSGKGRRKALSTARLDHLIEEATMDADDESEQKVGFCTMLEEFLALTAV